MFSKLQYISQGKTAKEQYDNIYEALDGGCDWVQLRFKNSTYEEITALAEDIKKLCDNYAATFIINDHPEIAKQTDADGVHLGLQDVSIAEAKAILGSKIIGGTANTFQHVMQRVQDDCSYIGLGPFRYTTTKERLSPILGLEGYAAIMKEVADHHIDIPIYAIGGIVANDIPSIIQTGIYGVAVSGIITRHREKKLLLQQINTLLHETINHS